MRKLLVSACFLLSMYAVQAQSKKPLNHAVYDQWQSVQSTQISHDGKWVVYQVNPQEGDGVLIIQSSDGSYKKTINRGYSQLITEDSRYVVFKIKPFFRETREARIKKKRPDEMPKDTLAMVELGKDSVWKTARVKSFKTPEKAGGWVAYLMEKALPAPPAPAPKPDSLTQINRLMVMADSLVRVADSIRGKATEAKTKGLTVLQPPKKEPRPAAPKPAEDPVEEGTELVLKNTSTGEDKKFKLVSDYYFSEKGNVLLIKTTRKNNDTITKACVLWVNTATGSIDTVQKGFNDAKNFAMDEEGTQVAFVAERDSVAKALRKYYKLWYYKPGMDSATLRAHRLSAGVKTGLTVSPEFNNKFSQDGKRLFLGLTPIRQPKDTSLVDFETARLDIWSYTDDELQPQQLVQLNNALRKSYLAIVSEDGTVLPLADEEVDRVDVSDEDNGEWALGRGNKKYRIQSQWEQGNYQDLYLINVRTGERKLIASKIRGGGSFSPKGKFVMWYDWKLRNYFAYNIGKNLTINISKSIAVPLWDEEDDHPDDPPPHGMAGWLENDAALLVYDKYDIWRVDPAGLMKPVCITNGIGRRKQLTFRNVNLDREERFIKDGQQLLLHVFDQKEKGHGWTTFKFNEVFSLNESIPVTYPVAVSPFTTLKPKQSDLILYTAQTPQMSPSLFVNKMDAVQKHTAALQLSTINEQQKDYNWFTVELHKWKMLDGKMSEGLLFKPENFDSTKKYPVIFYFYERDSDTRYNYRTPAPSASTVNIAYFTSNGYLVFDPNIYYKNGEPGESAFNSVVSAARYLSKMKWVDSTKMAIQGQSWGGYQVAYLITRTKMFAAAGAGAPVSNMFSAYGGIRWGSGISRQFQYEKSQTRLGFTPWQRPDLYTKNSPLFKADKVSTPLLMMHNDKDGAVPWYQGIEYFTALKRLGKKVWLLQYNDEDHNLVERRNRKDLSVRLGQFFDHYLKGAPMPVWMKEGVPATSKGIDWGLDIK